MCSIPNIFGIPHAQAPKVVQASPPPSDVENQRSTEALRRGLPFNSLGLASTILTSGLGTTGATPTNVVSLGGGGVA